MHSNTSRRSQLQHMRELNNPTPSAIKKYAIYIRWLFLFMQVAMRTQFDCCACITPYPTKMQRCILQSADQEHSDYNPPLCQVAPIACTSPHCYLIHQPNEAVYSSI
ncbi:hypothetical protein [Rubritalea tangerina]|uniref:hypothetical protein n=1 Tax=Rubritalea tangerina TaxID=430798 RepID=UPI00361F07D6